ncbi:CRISPR system Cascade subunit CasB [Methylomarinovum caldicuralii]|uniref:CRISPR system Cascade subunit CasB n=1 Tax=Methylomarinovum caldicuralii TaxID=438856 RepID=A0AAU9C1L2_9GAMM|nr:type I-E CRISPR-associated protein Cse2/CasB [Methylomarinovum caldicuralii]BCX82600.1 CRISPR system Cascade subunit CasB [Methylomarinovum caldicuralii]
MQLEPTIEASLPGVIGHIAGVIGSDRFDTGERAALRRMAPGHPPPLAFYRFALRHLPEDWERNLEDWKTLVAGIALMAPHAHRPRQSLGRVLGESGYSEARLERLLASEGNTRRLLLLRAARFLGSKTLPCDWCDGARLLLTRDAEKRETVHRRIARDFYLALDH